MVFSNTKVANIGQQGKQVLLFICIWLYLTNHHSDSLAMTDYRCIFSTLDRHRKLNQLRWRNMSAHLTNETSYWLKKLLMQLNRAVYNVCDLNIDPMFVFPDLVTGSGSANTVSTATGLSATQREACMRSLTTQEPKRLPRVNPIKEFLHHTMDLLWEKFQWIIPLYMKPISFQSKASVVWSFAWGN